MSQDQALRVGIGGPVGSGKTALVQALCKHLRDHYQIAVVTNDIYTQEDAQFLQRHGALEEDWIRLIRDKFHYRERGLSKRDAEGEVDKHQHVVGALFFQGVLGFEAVPYRKIHGRRNSKKRPEQRND